MASDSFLWKDDNSARHLVHPQSLLHFCSNVWSQRGDDGIIRRIFALLGIDTGFFIEFGAWDGVYLSNSRALALRGWSGCFIEADGDKYRELCKNYMNRQDILCLQAFIASQPSNNGRTLDELSHAHFRGRNIDFLSIDIDGLDYLILEGMNLRPKVVCVEGGFSWHPRFSVRVPDEVAALNLQQPLAVLCNIAKQKKYMPICFNQNVYLVAEEFSAPFYNIANDPVSLWRDAWFNETENFRRNMLAFRKHPIIRALEGPEYEDISF